MIFSSTASVANAQSATYAYITNQQDNTVSVIDTATNTVTATVNVRNQAYGVAVTPDGTEVYVANDKENTVSVIDTDTNTVTATVSVGNLPKAFGQFIGSIPVSEAEIDETEQTEDIPTGSQENKGTVQTGNLDYFRRYPDLERQA